MNMSLARNGRALARIISGVAVASLLAFSLYLNMHDGDTVGAVAPAYHIEPQHTPSQPSFDNETYTNLLGYHVSDETLEQYRRVFAFQENGKWKQAERIMRSMDDGTLMGAVLKQRYLHDDYKSSYSELKHWLKHYSDLPEAERIVSLAKRKKPAGEKLPKVSYNTKTLKGSGIRDGLGGETMPRAWKAGLDAWEEGEYHTASTIFNTVSKAKKISPWHKAAAHFWAFRANQKAGYDKQAFVHLNEASKYPFTLYGALAANALEKPIDASYDMPELSMATLKLLPVRRATYYVALGMNENAEEELRALYPTVANSTKQELITVAARLNLPALQIRMSQMLYRDRHNSNVAAYPQPRWIPEYDMMIDPALVFAITRQESGFDPNARNGSSGASGLMQLMPKTAEYVFDQYRLDEVQLASLDMSTAKTKRYSNDMLFNPQINMLIGQHYVEYLQKKPYIQDNLVHMLAAYNAGPGNMYKWAKRYEKVNDPLLFVERIPFKETRQYVKQVLSNYVVYSELIHGDQREATALINGKWPTIRGSNSRWAGMAGNKLAKR